MPRSGNPLNLVSAALLAFAALITAPIGFAGALSDTGPMRPVFGVMALCSLLMVAGAVQTVVRWRRNSRLEEEHQHAIRAAVQQRAAVPASQPDPPWATSAAPSGFAPSAAVAEASAAQPEPPRAEAAPPSGAAAWPPTPEAAEAAAVQRAGVLVHWTYAPDEWSAYTRREIRYRVREAVWVGLGIMLLGLLIGRSEGLAAAVFVGGLIIVGRLMMAYSANAANRATPGGGEAVITPGAVMLNGKYHVLQDEQFHFGGVRYLENGTPPVLEFTVKWRTRGGVTNDQVRVPVPRGREAEARDVVAAFQRGYASAG